MPGDFDLVEAIAQARKDVPMDALFVRYGLGEHCDKTANKKKECPFCRRVGTFGPHFIKDKSCWTFRCFGSDCPAAKENRTTGGDEIGFVGLMEKLPRKDAMWVYLAMAGIEKPKAQPREPKPGPEGEPGPEDLRSDAPPADAVPDNVIPIKTPPSPPKAQSNFGGGDKGQSIWQTFHSLLQLRNEDRAAIRSKRGLSDDVIDRLGFRSNCLTNEAALQILREKFPMRDLLRTGLWKRGRNGTPTIETQFTGWGMTGKAGDGENWGQVERPLIPYLDKFGRVFFMRPHKGNIAKADKDDDEVCGGHVYCPFLLAGLIEQTDGLLVLTESEFKAAALFACGIPALGIPGTSFVRNRLFREELVRILMDFKVRQVVVVFDNENKSDPELPGYKSDPWDRFDTAVWAKYIAWDLMRRTPKPPTLEEVRLGWLPDEWRKDDLGLDTGKVDWDTALARFISRAASQTTGLAAATKAFWEVVQGAVIPAEFDGFFPAESHQIIGKKLGDLWHVPLLPAGGRREEKLAGRFDGLNGASPVELVLCARNMSKALRSCVGTYYERKPPTDRRRASLVEMKEDINKAIDKFDQQATPESDAAVRRLKLEKRLVTELLEGVPEPLSNFLMRCEYCLHGIDGTTQRLVRFTDTLGRKTALIRLPGEAMAGLKDFREFCYTKTKGVASWRGGEKHLQCVNEDMIHSSAHRDIFEIDSYGYHAPSKLWFFGDCAFAPDGTLILTDANSVFWWQGVGYQIDASVEDRGLSFDQGAPLLAVGTPNDIRTPSDNTMPPLAYLWDTFQTLLFETVGDWDALYILGMAISYAVGPELFHARGCQPGLWLYGKRASGKTTIARWLLRIWGFPELTGIRIDRGTTHVGMARDLNQYCFLPFWFDEYRRDVDEQKESVLRGAFDRSGASKGMMDGTNKTRNVKARTIPLVTGEASSADAATRSRYGHALISASRRAKTGEKGRYDKLQSLSRNLHLIGHYLMKNRAVFVEQTLSTLDKWLDEPSVRDELPDERTRVVHGVGFAAFSALNGMLKIWDRPEAQWEPSGQTLRFKEGSMLGHFGKFLIRHAQQAFADVQEATMVNQFWQGVISGIQRGEIPKTLFLIDNFIMDAGTGRFTVHTPNHLAPKIEKPCRIMFFAARPVYDLYANDIRRGGTSAPLSYGDILRDLCKEEELWVKPPADATRVHRVYIARVRHSCWGIYLNHFPFAEDFEDALAEAGGEKQPFSEPERD